MYDTYQTQFEICYTIVYLKKPMIYSHIYNVDCVAKYSICQLRYSIIDPNSMNISMKNFFFLLKDEFILLGSLGVEFLLLMKFKIEIP